MVSCLTGLRILGCSESGLDLDFLHDRCRNRRFMCKFVPESKPHTIMIRLNVFIKVDESNREAVIEAAKKLVASSLEDKGCIAYDIFASQTRPDVLMICETWSDAAALDVHQKSAHFTTLVPEIESMAQMKIESFEF